MFKLLSSNEFCAPTSSSSIGIQWHLESLMSPSLLFSFISYYHEQICFVCESLLLIPNLASTCNQWLIFYLRQISWKRKQKKYFSLKFWRSKNGCISGGAHTLGQHVEVPRATSDHCSLELTLNNGAHSRDLSGGWHKQQKNKCRPYTEEIRVASHASKFLPQHKLTHVPTQKHLYRFQHTTIHNNIQKKSHTTYPQTQLCTNEHIQSYSPVSHWSADKTRKRESRKAQVDFVSL